MKAQVLIVDDERIFRALAKDALEAAGFDVQTVTSLAQARHALAKVAPDIVVLDRRLPDGDGMDLLRAIRAGGDGDPLVILVSAYADIPSAVDALQTGANDFLAKPVQPAELVHKLRKAIELRGLRDRLAHVSAARRTTSEPKSPLMQRTISLLRRVSASRTTPVLLTGPSGAGKQYAAEALHFMTFSGVPSAPFVDINCAALPSNLVESELFGYERGAFTDAKTSHRGLIDLADGGTLFLDEIAELPEASQAKLLKFLDSMRFRRVGGQREVEVELRIIAATNKPVELLVQEGRLREDLYHRLSVFSVEVPPLSARKEDIPDLARAFAAQFAERVKKRITGISDTAMARLLEYDYPGNVRELSNIIERAIILADGAQIMEDDLLLGSKSKPARDRELFFSVELEAAGQPPRCDAVERAYVVRVLEWAGGRRTAAAQALGLSYPTFLKRLRELNVPDE